VLLRYLWLSHTHDWIRCPASLEEFSDVAPKVAEMGKRAFFLGEAFACYIRKHID
jgi:hypothetical protein